MFGRRGWMSGMVRGLAVVALFGVFTGCPKKPKPPKAPTVQEQVDEKLDAAKVALEAGEFAKAMKACAEANELKADSARAIDDAIDLMPDDLYLFFELPSAGDPRGLIAALVGGEAGAKIRTGGGTADLHPGPADVARFIATCAAADVPFKATGGLHHPLTHDGEGAQTREFGFLNLVIAAVLALNADLDERDLIRVLEEDDINAFTFDDAGLKWRDHRATVEEIEDTRLAFAASIACSSFDEPRRNLRAIGLL